MAKKQWTVEERKAFADKMKAARQAKPQTKTTTKDPGNSIILTQEQFDTLIKRLDQGNVIDRAPAPSMAPGVGLQTNAFGQVVGTMTKFNIDPSYYPNPVESLLTDFDQDPKMRRLSIRENFFITFDMTAKPYQTKDNISVQEPTFHVTIYQNIYDDEGVETSKSIVWHTLHLNEDEELARTFASEQGVEVGDNNLKELLDRTRYARIRQFLVDCFFPPRNFELNVDSQELAIGGQVVKVVTKSNVKGFGNPTPTIKDEELS